jgi:tripartite-type tricarboxylate transporter receptor subunit TctC
MRKIVIALILMSVLPSAWAKIPVTVVWPFGVGSTLLNYTRATINKANQDQNKYNFILDIKPGAAGAIGAAHTTSLVDSGQLAVLSTTDAFLIRPILVAKNTNYKTEDFQPVLLQVSTPMSLVGKPDTNLETILKKPKASIGSVGLGTGTHVMGEQIRQRAADMVIVPFKDPPESVKEVISGNMDLSWENLPLAIDNPRLQIYGITGKTHVPGIKNLADLGFPSMASLDIGSFIVAPKKMNPKQFAEIQNILINAQKNNKFFDDSVTANRGVLINVGAKDYNNWFTKRNEFFQNVTRSMGQVE